MANGSLLLPRWVVPVEPAGKVLEDHAVAIRDGRIEAIAPAPEARARFREHEPVELAGQVLIPGLVNAHTHAAMTLMRGLADDLPLMRWLQEHVWPAETRHVSRDFVRDGTLLACAEMLRGGITCFNDMYFFPDAALEASLAAGIRSAHGIIAIEFPSSDATFRQVATLAAELDLPVHVHVHETADEIERSMSEHGVRPIERLRRLGLLGPSLIAVHAVHVRAEEIQLLSRHGCSVVHCPSSNLKLASGFAPVAALLKAQINVALGTDGAASNNRLDLFQEMRTAALLAKAVSRDAEAMPAHAALRAATLAGAQALGIAATTGSIERGKAADLVAVSMSAPELAPCYDPVSHLV